MNTIKSTWTTFMGSISSIIPMFFTVCKSGVCTVACASPIASILGISSASLIASPLTQSLFPLLLVLSAVAFTVSYYKIYVLPKYANTTNTCDTDCACVPTKSTFQYKFSVWTFWVGLASSTLFFTYFEYQNYLANTSPKPNVSMVNPLLSPDSTGISSDSLIVEKPCCSDGKKCK